MTQQQHKAVLWLIGDQLSVLQQLRTTLGEDLYNYRIITNTSHVPQVDAVPADLLILHLREPRSGLLLCRRVNQMISSPLLAIAYDTCKKDQVLDAGADDCLDTTYDDDELRARVRALLRRQLLSPNQIPLTWSSPDGILQVDFASQEVIVAGERKRLTPTEVHLLHLLITHQNKVMTHQQLLEQVWGQAYRQERTYTRVYLHYLRLKMEPEPDHPRYLQTIPGVGYMFKVS